MTREELIDYVMQADVGEYGAVRHVLCEWQEQYPDDPDPDYLLLFLNCSEEAFEKSKAELRAIQDKIAACGPACLTREEVARFGLASRGVEGVAKAREILFAWERAHAHVPRMYEVFEQLFMMEDAARGMAEEGEAAHSETTPEAVTA